MVEDPLLSPNSFVPKNSEGLFLNRSLSSWFYSSSSLTLKPLPLVDPNVYESVINLIFSYLYEILQMVKYLGLLIRHLLHDRVHQLLLRSYIDEIDPNES